MQYIKDLILGTLIYNSIFNLNKHYDNNIKKTHVTLSLVHCITTSIYSGYYLLSGNELSYYTMTLTSGSYFLYDFYYYAKYEKYNITSIVYMIHHIISFYVLQQEMNRTIAIAFFMAEVSNIPNNLTYRAIKNGVKEESLKILKAVQLYSWILFRMVGLPIWVYIIEKDEFIKLNMTSRWISSLIMILTYYWGVKLIKKMKLVDRNNDVIENKLNKLNKLK